MMTDAQMIAAIRRITYKPGWRVVAAPFNQHSGWYEGDATVSVRCEFTAPCAVTGASEIQVCAQHLIDGRFIPDEKALFNRVLHIVRQAEEHEVLEFFKVDGVPLYDPHR
jgi:hypothetical protein